PTCQQVVEPPDQHLERRRAAVLEEVVYPCFDCQAGFLARRQKDEMAVPRALPYAANLEPQKLKGFARKKVDHGGLFHVHLNPEGCEMFLEALQGPCSPAPFRVVPTHGDDDIIRKPMIVHGLIDLLYLSA